MTRTRARIALAAVAVVAVARAAPAAAHVAPSVGDNNRYVKVTPLGDRLRLAYTVIYGQFPGALLRKTIDANHDGAIDDAESRAFGAALAARVAAGLEVTIDGARRPVAWREIVVGLGTPETVAGTFSVDLVAALCLATPRGTHEALVRDRFQLERPGETEVKVEDSPGIKVDHARIGVDDDLGEQYKIVGPGGPLQDDGLDLQFTAGAHAPLTADGACADTTPARSTPTAVIAGAAAAGAFLVAAIIALVRHLRRARRRRA